ncbi:MAG: hypothetical protein ACLFV8_14060 [Alphaproteobacteria bacterium]
MAEYPGFTYADGMAIEKFDKVEVNLEGGAAEGVITRLHPLKNTVRVRYDTGEVHRTTGNPVMATGEFNIEKIELVARDG